MSVLGTDGFWVDTFQLPGSGGMTSRTWWHGGCDELANDQLPVAWSPVINQDSRYGYLMMFEYWQISYIIICCTKAPVSAKTCEAWFIMCIYIYIYIVHTCVFTYVLFSFMEGWRRNKTRNWWCHTVARTGAWSCVYWSGVVLLLCLDGAKSNFFLPSKNNMDHTIYIYIQGLDFDRFWQIFDAFWWILMYFDVFWCILMYVDRF